jgi:hypothetical protein
VRPRRRTACAVLLATSAAAVVPLRVSAQTSHGLVEVGAARLQQRDIPTTHAATAGLTVRHDAHRHSLAAAGAVTLADEGRSTSQGLLTASLLGRPGGRTRWEIGGALTAFDQGAASLTGGAYIFAREHFAIGRYGAWAGIAVGGVEDADYWSPMRTAEMGSWFTAARATRLSASIVLVDTRSEPYGGPGNLVTDPVTYADASLALRWGFRRRIDVDVRGGLRSISRGALTPSGRGSRPFAAADVAVWMTSRVALAASLGRQLSDLARGTPDTRFAALALRFTMNERPAAPAPPRRRPVVETMRLAVVMDSGGSARIVVTAPNNALVELAASFTSWEPVSLVRRGDVWELQRPIPSGAHRVLVRVDGGPWTVPPNLPAAPDDFGGTVGILTVP